MAPVAVPASMGNPSPRSWLRLRNRRSGNGLQTDLRRVDLLACHVSAHSALHTGNKVAELVAFRNQVSAAARALFEPEHPSLLITNGPPARCLYQVGALPG